MATTSSRWSRIRSMSVLTICSPLQRRENPARAEDAWGSDTPMRGWSYRDRSAVRDLRVGPWRARQGPSRVVIQQHETRGGSERMHGVSAGGMVRTQCLPGEGEPAPGRSTSRAEAQGLAHAKQMKYHKDTACRWTCVCP